MSNFKSVIALVPTILLKKFHPGIMRDPEAFLSPLFVMGKKKKEELPQCPTVRNGLNGSTNEWNN